MERLPQLSRSRRRWLDFAPIARAIQSTGPDLVFIASYPIDSVGLYRSINEIGLKATLVGGGAVGPQFTTIMKQLGPLLNNALGYELYIPSSTMNFPGVEEFIARYQKAASGQGVDPLGFYVPPFVYAAMEIVGQAVEKAKTLDQKALARRFTTTRSRPSSARSGSRPTANGPSRGC